PWICGATANAIGEMGSVWRSTQESHQNVAMVRRVVGYRRVGGVLLTGIRLDPGGRLTPGDDMVDELAIAGFACGRPAAGRLDKRRRVMVAVIDFSEEGVVSAGDPSVPVAEYDKRVSGPRTAVDPALQNRRLIKQDST